MFFSGENMKNILIILLGLLTFIPVLRAESLEEILEKQAVLSFSGSEAPGYLDITRRYISTLDPDGRAAMEWIFVDGLYRAKPEANQALFLLAYALKNCNWENGETMPIALALSYNYNYSQGNNEVKAKLRADILEHFTFYRELNDWQKTRMPDASLSKLPVIAQTYWSSRDRSVYETREINSYNKYLLSIRDLKRLFLLVSQNPALSGQNVVDWAQRIGRWYREQRLPRESLTNDISGYAAGPLMRYQERMGRFPASSCVTDATNLTALFQSVGLAPLTYYQNFRTAGTTKGTNHEWPTIFDPSTRIWTTVQRGNPWPTFTEADVPVDFEIFRPMWHHLWIKAGMEESAKWGLDRKAPYAHIGGSFRRNSYGERTTNKAMRDFVFAGIDENTMLRIWRYAVWQRAPDGMLTRNRN